MPCKNATQNLCHGSPRGGQRIVYPYQVGSSPIHGAKHKIVLIVRTVTSRESGLTL